MPSFGHRERVEPLVTGVLHLLDADRHGEVVGARGHRVGRLPQRLGAGGAHVLDAGDRLALEPERLGEQHPAHAALRGAEPVGVDVVLGDARRTVNASPVASRSRSSRPLSQCSAKRVHPIPTMATRSLIPWLAHQMIRAFQK